MSTTLFLIILALGASMIGLKIYLQERHKEAEVKEEATPVKSNEQVVAERLAEIAVKSEIKEVVKETPVQAPVQTKKPVKKSAHKKKQPKIKAK